MTDKLLALDAASSPEEAHKAVMDEIKRINQKQNYFHYFDIRTNHLNEKDWRRSFSINQLLYGMILYAAKNGDFETFDAIMEHLKEEYKGE